VAILTGPVRETKPYHKPPVSVSALLSSRKINRYMFSETRIKPEAYERHAVHANIFFT